jgi:hypothetical protein
LGLADFFDDLVNIRDAIDGKDGLSALSIWAKNELQSDVPLTDLGCMTFNCL